MSTSNFVLVTGGADLGFIALAAVRYAMGRRTYAPSLVCATFASAVGYVASIQMRAAFRTLPEDVRERLREEARRL